MTTQILLQAGKSLTWPINYAVFFSDLVSRIKKSPGLTTQEGNSQSMNILLAEDDPDDRELFEEAILHIDRNINVHTAKNGNDLIKKLENGPLPDVIYLDLNMPGLSGKECLTEIKSRKEWYQIPVFIYSTSINKKDIGDTHKAGATLYLVKPSNFRDLIQLIRDSFSVDLDRISEDNLDDFILKINR